MANTIGSGNANSIPFYDVTGTDLVPMTGGVSYDKTNKILSIPGFSINKPIYTGGYGFSGMSFQNFYAGQPVNTFNFVRGRGNFTTKAVPVSGDQLANITIAGWGGSTPVVGASIKATLVGTASGTSMPTEIAFGTNDGTSFADRLKITQSGQLNVNTISNFSGSDLTLSPSGKVVLGAPSKVNISGGTNGQSLITDGSGNLSWATITGATGPQGPQGPTGATGPQGPQGLKGDTGATGATGPQGPTGATGPKGDTGSSGVLSGSKTVTVRGSGAAYTDVTYNNNTLYWNRVGNFCHWQLYLYFYNAQGGSGTFLIDGLPFPAIVDGFEYGPAARVDLGTVTTDAQGYPRYINGQSYMLLSATKGGGLNNANISVAHVATAGAPTGGGSLVLIAQGQYRCDPTLSPATAPFSNSNFSAADQIAAPTAVGK
jgi:hypothetical protein